RYRSTADRRGRSQTPPGGIRLAWTRGNRDYRSRARTVTRRRLRARRTAAGRHRLRPGASEAIRLRPRDVSRPGFAGAEARSFRRRSQRHARVAYHPHLRRPRDGTRACRQRQSQRGQPHRGDQARCNARAPRPARSPCRRFRPPARRIVKPHRPRKRFGQHFLADDAVVEAILAAIAPRRDDSMTEIGPGLGALTRALAERVAHLHVVEIDRDIVARLRTAFAGSGIAIHEGDALKFDFGRLGIAQRIVGNLPYNIPPPLLFHLSRYGAAIRDIHVMLQQEVVERMIATPSTAEYGRLSVMLQYRFRMERLLDVPAGAFQPAPKVESALVRM